jgi:hypothetical protein
MADDQRPDAPDAPDPEIAGWLDVEPLDELTRRRLVATALRGSEADHTPSARRPSRTWRWLAAAAAIVVVLAGGLALLTARGGHDESEQATLHEQPVLTPKATAAVPDVGDFGDLDQAANVDALRAAVDQRLSSAAVAPEAATSAAGDSTFGSTTARGPCPEQVPAGAAVIARGSGTVDGRHATVVVVQRADGTRTYDAVLEDPCEVRHLS